MKRFAALLLAAALCLALTACGSGHDPYGILGGSDAPANTLPEQGETADDSAAVEEQEQETAAENAGSEGKAASASMPVFYAADEMPTCLSEDLQLLYSAAMTIWKQYNYTDAAGFRLDYSTSFTNSKGWGYYLCTDYESYAQMREIMLGIFTEGMVQELEAREMVCEGADGRVYMIPCGRGSNISYVGSEFAITHETQDELVLQVTGIYNDGADFTQRGDPADDYCEYFDIVLVKVNGEWRFDTFRHMGD